MHSVESNQSNIQASKRNQGNQFKYLTQLSPLRLQGKSQENGCSTKKNE